MPHLGKPRPPARGEGAQAGQVTLIGTFRQEVTTEQKARTTAGTPMGRNKRSLLGAVLTILLLQITGILGNWQICHYDFEDKEYHFSVAKSLEPGMVVGKVFFETCGAKTNIKYKSQNSHFDVQSDGSIVVKDNVKLHGQKEFNVVAFDGNNELSETTVTLRKRHPHHKEADLSNSSKRRQKRDWVIPPIICSENERGPFPKRLTQVSSSKSKEITVYYSLTGQGADSPPVGTFVMERNTGWLNVTRQLDRETISKYLLLVYAVSSNGQQVENPIDITIRVTDQNDNRPVFTKPVFEGTIVEGSKPGTSVMTVSATDLDDTVDTNNGIIWYSIESQEPQLPSNNMFTIDPPSGVISVVMSGLDREKVPSYTLVLKATDQEGNGYETTGKAVITVTDANDNAPVFNPTSYFSTVRENEVGVDVALLTVTDDDIPNTDAWTAVFKIIKGNEGNFFSITTTPDNMGQIKTIKGLDYEAKRQHILQVVATNKANFTVPLLTSTATVTVDVTDVNEAPVFVPSVKDVSVPEDLPSGQEVASYTAQDPDKAQNQKITYYMGNDPAGWLNVNPDNGIITGNGQLDRESMFVKNNTYRAIILAVDNGVPSETGTGTLQIILGDVNDNGPYLEYADVIYCQKSPDPLSVNIIDRDLPPFTSPYKAQLSREARENWTASVVNDKFEIKPNREMPEEIYHVPVTLADSQDKTNTTTLRIQVCQCTADNNCDTPKALAGGLGLPVILAILGGILALLILLLLLLLFVRRKKVVKEPLLPPEDDTRDNIYSYDEEGGGEEDQNFDLGQLHRGLDARPDVIRNDVAPTLMPAPQYRPRPANPDEIGNFIDENLNAADNDPTAPPYDSLLVFDYEGSGSEAASLSSLNSSSSGGDQDYSALNDWGPRFKKLADMYGGDED